MILFLGDGFVIINDGKFPELELIQNFSLTDTATVGASLKASLDAWALQEEQKFKKP